MKYNRQVFERYLTESEEKQLLRTVKQYGDVYAQRDYWWMRLLRNTGLRVQALHLLNVSDARAALRCGRLWVRPEINKGKKRGYWIHVNKFTRQSLTALLRIRRDMGFAEQGDAPLLLSRKRLRISVRSLQDRMQHWVRVAGLNSAATPHWWRHTLAKRIMKHSTATDPRGVVQAALGQSDINSTVCYTVPDRDDVEQVMAEVAA